MYKLCIVKILSSGTWFRTFRNFLVIEQQTIYFGGGTGYWAHFNVLFRTLIIQFVELKPKCKNFEILYS